MMRILKFDRKIFRITVCRGQPSELKWHNNLRRASRYQRLSHYAMCWFADFARLSNRKTHFALIRARCIESFKLLLYPCPPSTHVSPIVFSIYHIYCGRDRIVVFEKDTRYDESFFSCGCGIKLQKFAVANLARLSDKSGTMKLKPAKHYCAH